MPSEINLSEGISFVKNNKVKNQIRSCTYDNFIYFPCNVFYYSFGSDI